VKSFIICKLALSAAFLGGALLLAPASRAQADLAPDHFDGTDSWAAAAQVPVTKAKPVVASATQQAKSNKPGAPTVQPVSARQVATAPRPKTASRNKKNRS
jgi:hypothetical protein